MTFGEEASALPDTSTFQAKVDESYILQVENGQSFIHIEVPSTEFCTEDFCTENSGSQTSVHQNHLESLLKEIADIKNMLTKPPAYMEFSCDKDVGEDCEESECQTMKFRFILQTVIQSL